MLKTENMKSAELKKIAETFKECAECLPKIKKVLDQQKKLLTKISSLGKNKSTAAEQIHQKMFTNLRSGKPMMKKLYKIMNNSKKYNYLMLKDEHGNSIVPEKYR